MRFAFRHGMTLGLLAALLLTGSVRAAVQHGATSQSRTAAVAPHAAYTVWHRKHRRDGAGGSAIGVPMRRD